MLEPIVRQMILCEDARLRKGSRGKVDVMGLINQVRAPEFPINLAFAVYLCLTDCRGTGRGQIIVAKGGSGTVVYRGELHSFDFGADPIALYGRTIRVSSCELPASGLFSVQFVYNGVVLKE